MDFSNERNSSQTTETITAKRRWIHGEKKAPFTVCNIEKLSIKTTLNEFDFSVAHYAQKGCYSVRSDGTNVVWRYTTDDKKKEVKTDLNEKIQSIIPVEEGNLFLVITDRGHLYLVQNDKVYGVDNNNNYFFTIAQCVRNAEKENEKFYIFGGTRNGEIVMFEIVRKGGIEFKKIISFKPKSGVPISSINMISYNGSKFLLVSTYLNIFLYPFPNNTQQQVTPQQSEDITAAFLSDNLENHNLPSSILCNEKYIVWFNEYRLCIFPIENLFSNSKKEMISLSTPKIVRVINKLNNNSEKEEEDFMTFVKNDKPRLIITHQHLLIASNKSIMSICLNNGKISFRYPIVEINVQNLNENNGNSIISVNRDYSGDYFTILTQQCIFKGSFENETSPSEVLSCKEIKENHLKQNNFKDCQPSEILLELIKESKWDIIEQYLTQLIFQNSDEDIQYLIQFLLFEFQIYHRSEHEKELQINGIENFVPKSFITSNIDNIYQICIYLLKMRAFSDFSKSLNNKDFFTNVPKNKKYYLELFALKRYEDLITLLLSNNENWDLIPSIAIRSPKSFQSFLKGGKVSFPILSKILPHLNGYIKNTILFSYFKKAVQLHDNNLIIEILLALSNNPDSKTFDKSIYDLLKPIEISTAEPMILFYQFRKAGLYLTASYFALKLNLINEALECCEHLEAGDVQKYQEEFNKIYQKNYLNILNQNRNHLKIKEDAVNIENLSPKEIISEFEKVVISIGDYKEKSEEFGILLNEIENMNDKSENNRNFSQSDIITCESCQKVISDDEFVVFECGHTYHLSCLEEIMIKIIPSSVLSNYKELKPNGSQEAQQEILDIITQDCPFCGAISTELLEVPLVDTQEEDPWSLDK